VGAQVWEKLTDANVPLDVSEIVAFFPKDKPRDEEEASAKQKAKDEAETPKKGKAKAQSLLDPKV
jgi:hypothetical protein